MRLFRHTLALAVVTASLSILTQAQTLTPVYQYSFNGTGSDGANPQEAVTQASDGNIYSVSFGGGDNANGSVLKITPSGTASTFYTCNAAGANGAGTDCEGLNNLIQLPDGNFWGTSFGSDISGYNQYGNIVKLTLGGVMTTEYSFVNDQYGAFPNSNIVYVESCDCIYGTTIGTNAVDSGDGGTAPFGSVYSYHVGLVSGTKGMTHAYDFGNSGSNQALGVQPVDGVTVVNGTVYGTSQVGLNSQQQYGVLWSFNSTLTTGTVLHTFTDGLDGAYPSAPPSYYRPDGNIYGTTLQSDDNQPDSGSIYKSSLTGTFAPVFTFTDTALHNFNGAPTFDTAGNLIVGTGQGGANAVGALYLEPRAGGTPVDLFDFSTGSIYGDHPQSSAFFDNTGKMWTVERGGTENLFGAIDKWTLSTETAAPIKITVSPATATVNENVTVTWSASNAFSDEEEVCWATGGNSAFQGVQTGTYASGVYSGSKTFSSGSQTGTQVLTIVCGGKQSASTTLTIGSGSGPVATTTTVTASPNPVTAGTTVTLTATVKKSSGTGIPTGSVVFKTGTTVIDTIAVDGTGKASLPLETTGFPAGVYPITASYGGDTNDQASSGSTNLTVNAGSGPVSTTTTLTGLPNPVTVGSNLSLTATVKRNSGTGVPGGTFSYKVGTVTLTTATVTTQGVDDYLISTAGLPIGVYPVVVTYSGDANDLASTSNTVNVSVIKKTTTTALVVNPNPDKIGTAITFTATVTPSTGTTTGTVNFNLGTNLLETVTLSGDKAVLTLPTTGLPAGTYPINAVYSGDANDDASTSSTVNVTLLLN